MQCVKACACVRVRACVCVYPPATPHTQLYKLQTKCEQSVPQFFLDKLKKSQDFVEQLLDPRRIESYEVPTWISAELRSYQKDGVNWLAFLSRFNLHGILCDGEGVGVLVREDVIVRDGVWVREGVMMKDGVLSEKSSGVWLWLGAKDSVQWFDSSLPVISSSDMGLGKTLQSICMLAGDHAQRKNAPAV